VGLVDRMLGITPPSFEGTVRTAGAVAADVAHSADVLGLLGGDGRPEDKLDELSDERTLPVVG